MLRTILYFMSLFLGFGCLAAWVTPAEANQMLDFGSLGLIGMAGMIVNRANLAEIFLNLKTTFNKAFETAPSIWEKTTMKVPSGSSQNNYNWLSRFPKMREWVGDKVLKSLEAFKYTIENKSYEATVSVKRDDIDDDNLGIYGPQAQDAGFSAKQWPDELDADLKNGAFAAKCYDDQYFYDTDHPVGDGNGGTTSVSNKLVVALSCATKAAALASYGAARTAMMSFKDDEARPLGLIGNILEVGPALEAVGRTLCYSEKLDDNSPNPYRGTAELVVNPRLTSTTQWMLHCTTRAVKPFIFQERKAPVFVQATDPSSDDVFMRAEFKLGAEARGAAGYGLWQLSVGSTGAGA